MPGEGAAAAAVPPTDIGMPTWMKRSVSSPESAAEVAKQGASQPPPPGGGGGNAPADAQAGGKLDKKTMNMLIRLSLSNSRAIAALEGSVYEAFEVPEQAPTDIGKLMAVTNQEYDQQSKLLKAQAQSGEKVDWKARGSPFVCLFVGVLKAAIDDMAADGGHPEPKPHQILRGFWNDVILKATPSDIESMVTHFRYKKARTEAPEPRVGVLTVAIQMRAPHIGEIWAVLSEYFLKIRGLQRLTGSAPRGPLERELGKQLDGAGKGK